MATHDSTGFMEALVRHALSELSDQALYLGSCIVQAPGAWTRVGPTWLDRERLQAWVVVSIGAARWGTSEGLAQLATSVDCKPQWHAPGTAIVPLPNLAFLIEPHVLQAEHMAPVRMWGSVVAAMIGETAAQ